MWFKCIFIVLICCDVSLVILFGNVVIELKVFVCCDEWCFVLVEFYVIFVSCLVIVILDV